MASPFNVFRKNQRVLMALLVGFSMIAFIAADVITPQNFPIFVGALLGALALWLLSGKGGAEGWLIAAVGGVLGAVVGVYGPNLFRGNDAVYTDRGSLTRQDIEEITQRQNKANEFLSLAINAVVAKAPKDKPLPIPQPRYFRFSDSSQADNAVLTYLFEQEADEMGIVIDDRDVTRYIVDITGGLLNDAELRRIRNDMQIGIGELVDILREQIRARDAFNLLYPRTGPTPQELWADFKKLNNEAVTTVATIPTEAFVDEVPDPSDTELTQFFNQYRGLPPSADGTPGFLVDRQMRVAYVEVALDDIKKRVKTPTDAEVRAYFEKNRAQFEFGKDEPGSAAPGIGEAPANGDGPAMTPEGEAAEGTPPAEAPRDNAPEQPSTTDATAEPSTDESPAPAEPTAPADEPSETPAPEETTEPETTEPETSTPEGDAAAPAESPSPNEGEAAVSRDGYEFVAFQQDDASPAAGDSDTPQPETAPADPAPADPASTETTPADPAPTDPVGAPAEESTDSPALPAPGAAESTPAANAEPTQEVLDSIRQQLINQRARDMADAALEKARDDVSRIVENVMDAVPLPEDRRDVEQQQTYERQRREAVTEVVKQVKEYATKNGLHFETTPLMSLRELYESGDYSIGKAVKWEKNAPLFGRETTSLVETLLQTTPEQPMTPIPAQSLLNESRYVALKIADEPPRPADLSEKGMRDRVVKAWKLRAARQLAKDRAEKLAKQAAQADNFETALKSATVTGKSGGKELTLETVGPFTWLRRSSAPRTDFTPPEILPSELPKLPAAGEEFMKTVFTDLKVGGTGVAPAADKSAYYVVHVDSKNIDEKLPEIRQAFLKEDFFHSPLDQYFPQPMNPFRRRMVNEAYEAQAEWFKNFRVRHGVTEDLAVSE